MSKFGKEHLYNHQGGFYLMFGINLNDSKNDNYFAESNSFVEDIAKLLVDEEKAVEKY